MPKSVKRRREHCGEALWQTAGDESGVVKLGDGIACAETDKYYF